MKTFDNEWEKVHSERDWGKYPPEEIIRFVAHNYFKLNRKSIKILDLGCGGGAISWFLAREGFIVEAVDGSTAAIQKAKKNIENEKLNVSFKQCDLAELPFPDNYFDAIVDSAAISANTSVGIDHILLECHRVLKQNGKILSSGLFKTNMTGFGHGEQIDDFTFRNIPIGSVANIGTVHFFTRSEIEKKWKSAGYSELIIDSVERSNNGEETFVNYFVVQATKLESTDVLGAKAQGNKKQEINGQRTENEAANESKPYINEKLSITVALVCPDIPQNTGNIARLCKATGSELVLVRPLGFRLTDNGLQRAGMDYWKALNPKIFDDTEEFFCWLKSKRCFFMSAHGNQNYANVEYQNGDVLIFGSESSGLTKELLSYAKDNNRLITLPMIQDTRCINVSSSASAVVYEALRQIQNW